MTTPDAPNDVARQLQPMQIEQDPVLAAPLDPAQQSLAEALRVSFGILKVAMLALLVAYAFSGTFSVGSNEVALRLRFGEYVGSPGSGCSNVAPISPPRSRSSR